MSKRKLVDLTELYTTTLPRPCSLEESQHARIKQAAAIGIFKRPQKEVLAWAKRCDGDLLDLFLAFGIYTALSQSRVRAKYGANGVARVRKKGAEKLQERKAKAQEFDRFVELLDHKKVGDKILGDCTRFDLIRAAVSAETLAGELTIDAAFYRQLAGMLEGHITVRQASRRGQIKALLTTTYKEAA